MKEKKKNNCQMLIVNISPNVGTSTKHRHAYLALSGRIRSQRGICFANT